MSLYPSKIHAGDLAVVVGAGRSGKAACKLLAREGARVRLLEADPAHVGEDLRRELEALGVEICTGPHSKEQFHGAAMVVPSPGMPLLKLLEIMGDEQEPEILAEMELAWRYLSGEKVAAVTGTSGKTTTVSLTAAMLKAAGKKVFLGGNIGTPLSEYILSGEKADVLVLEISSFQLQTCSFFRPDVAVVINISPNHLDYHKDMEEYTDAKFQIFSQQGSEDFAILDPALKGEAEKRHLKAQLSYLQSEGRFTNMLLFGEHNRLNAETAWQIVNKFGVDLPTAQAAATSFAPIPHRLERVCETKGVLYINDSKSTTLASMEIALRAMDRPVLLLCGGKFKGGDLDAVKPLLREKVRQIAGFGDAREVFEPAWKETVPISWFPTLRPAMEFLYGLAKEGDVILLSPGTASFDLYKGMAYRGQDFKNIAADFSAR